jgi:hypothetical protein
MAAAATINKQLQVTGLHADRRRPTVATQLLVRLGVRTSPGARAPGIRT